MRSLWMFVALAACSDGVTATPDAAVDAPVFLDVEKEDTADVPMYQGDPAAPSKGPWVIRMETTHAIVRWESRGPMPSPAIDVQSPDGMHRTVMATSRETTVAQGYTGLPGVLDPDLAGTWYVHEVDLTGLSPATCYTYSIVGHADANGRVCTAHADTDRRDIRFMAIGDTNPVLGAHTVPILNAILPMNPEFTIHLGDMQYYSSITETYAYWFRAMAPMLRNGAILPSVGNHENELQEHEFADYYARLFNDPTRDGTLDYYHFATGGVHFFSLSTEVEGVSDQRQLAWLTGRMTEVESMPGFRFSVLYFHRPLYTVGDTSPRVDLRASIGQLAVMHHVPVVFAGHMHGYERFEVGAVTYVVSGGGGGLIGNVNENERRYPEDALLRRAAGPWLHAMMVTISEHTLRAQAIDETGAVLDMFEKTVP